jgi:hypothetical protein
VEKSGKRVGDKSGFLATLFEAYSVTATSTPLPLPSPGDTTYNTVMSSRGICMLGEKDVEEYLFLNQVEGHLKHEDYIKCPATAFLQFCIDAKESIEYCKSNFPKTEDNKKLNIESVIIIQHIVNSTLALLMGHFETYQKYLFAGTFERTIYLKDFNPGQFFRKDSGLRGLLGAFGFAR